MLEIRKEVVFEKSPEEAFKWFKHYPNFRLINEHCKTVELKEEVSEEVSIWYKSIKPPLALIST